MNTEMTTANLLEIIRTIDYIDVLSALCEVCEANRVHAYGQTDGGGLFGATVLWVDRSTEEDPDAGEDVLYIGPEETNFVVTIDAEGDVKGDDGQGPLRFLFFDTLAARIVQERESAIRRLRENTAEANQ